MKLAIVAATQEEWMPSFNVLKKYDGETRKKISFFITGVGMLASAISIMKIAYTQKPDLILQAGIAGSFDKHLYLGDIRIVKNETVADIGVQENGCWKDLFDLHFLKADSPPFTNRLLENPYLNKLNLLNLQTINAVTVNEISTNKGRIEQIVEKYNPVLESMEGAALHFACIELNIPFLQLRSVSNYIGERKKENWKIKEALENLNETLVKYVDILFSVTELKIKI